MSRALPAACAALLAGASLAACAVAPIRPDPGALQTLPPQDRSALLIDGELVRVANLQVGDHAVNGLVALRAQGGQPVYTYAGPWDEYAGGKLAAETDAYLALHQARAASPFHRPVKAQVGQTALWFVHDLVPTAAGPAGAYRSTLEVLAQEPRVDSSSFPAPLVVITLDSASSGKIPGTPAVRRPAAAVTLEAVTFAPDGTLEAVTMVPWRPTLAFMIQGKSARDLWGSEDAPTEHAINDALLEWKNLSLPGWLRQATPEQLAQAALETEKGVLALDLSIRLLKDKMDASARGGQEPVAAAGEAEQLMSQRKMLLTVILGAVKAAAAQRAAAPAP